MPELNFKITGDDSELKKTLANIAKIAKENGDKISKEVQKSTDVEVKSREKVVKATQDQKKASDEVVKATESEAKAQDKVTEAIKRKNAAFDANGRQIRPIQFSNTQDEINAANSGRVGTISGGTVVGSSLDFNKLANEAYAYGQAAKDAHNAAVTGANASVKSNEDIRKAIRDLQIQMQSYKGVAEKTKDLDVLAKYNNKIVETQAEITRLRNVGKAGFDELGNKLTLTAGKMEILNKKLQIYREGLLKAQAPQSFVNLNRKIQDTEMQLNQLKNAGRKGFDELGNAVQKSTTSVAGLWSGLKSVAAFLPGLGLAGLIGLISEPVLEAIKNLSIFKKSLRDSAAESGATSSQFKDAVGSVSSLKVAIEEYHKGVIKGSQLVQTYNDSIGQTAGKLKSVAEVEAFYNSKAGAFVDAMFLRAQAAAALEDATNKVSEAQKRSMGSNTLMDYVAATGDALTAIITLRGNIAGGFKDALSTFKARDVDELNKKSKESLKVFEELKKKSDQFNKDNGFAFDVKPEKTIKDIISQQESLQKRIDDIRAKYTRKVLSKDSEELAAVRDEFKKIMDAAIKFNANKDNKLHLVDMAGLTELRDNFIKDLEYRQSTEKTKIDLDKQKALYAEYEDYKTKLGRDAADARFGKELNAYITYLDVLKAKQKEITDIAPEKRTGGQMDYLSWLETQARAEELVEKKKYDALVKEFVSYNDQRKALTEKYEADIADMKAKGDDTTTRTTRYNEDLNNLDDANIRKLGAYKDLYKGIERLSDESAKKVIADAAKMLTAAVGQGKISKELAEEINKLIRNTSDSLKDRMPDRLIKLANEIDRMVDSVGGLDSAFGNVLGTLGNVVGQVGNIKKGFNDMKSAKKDGDLLGELTAGLGILSSGISIVTSVFGIGKKVKEMNAAARKEVSDFYALALSGERQYQDSLKDRELQLVRNNKLVLQGIRDELALRKTQSESYAKEAANIMSQLQGQEYIESETYKHGTWLRKAKVTKNMASLNGKSADELFSLLAQGKLEGDTKTLVERLKELEQKGYDAQQAIADLAKETSELFTGTTSDSLTDSLLEMFKSGKTGVQDLADFFKTTMDDAALSIFKNKVLAGAMESFYKEFDTAAQSGDELTVDEIARLNGLFTSLTGDALKKFEEFQKITGSDLKGSVSNTSSLQKSITSITTDQASALEGINRGQYEYLKLINGHQAAGNNIAQKNLNVSMQHLRWAEQTAANTLRTANNTDRLPAIETSLSAIAKNTTSGSFRGAGLG